jgi:uncharacterized iron-regulated membrane protein
LLYYSFEHNFYGVVFGEHDGRPGAAWLFFQGTDGHLPGGDVPGRGSLGEQFVQIQSCGPWRPDCWLAGRILIATTGLAVAVLSLTGVWLWWAKRRARSRVRHLRTLCS